MGESQKPTYSGMDKYPGVIATIITILIGMVFIGALYLSAGHPDDGHSGGHAEETH